MRSRRRTARRRSCYGSKQVRPAASAGPFAEEVMTQRTKPPFRADHVGSILRTAPVKDARAKREKGEITAAQLKEIEDREIEKIIKKKEEVGRNGGSAGDV